MKVNDELFIPEKQDLVSISGFIRTRELYKAQLLLDNRINVPFDGGRRALYYVREHGGGIAKGGSKKNITVQYPNGETKRTKNFLFFSRTPKVRAGSKINVGSRPIKPVEETVEEKKNCLLYTSPSPRDRTRSRMPSSA